MHSPNVSGALTYMYKELVMAAKNEERRKSALKKRKQYQNSPKYRLVVLPQLRLAKLVLVPVNLSLRTRDVVPNFVTIATNQDTGNTIVAIELSQKVLAVTHTPNPPIPLTKPILRLSKPHLPLLIMNQSPKYRILCHCFIRRLTRATAFV